MEINKIYKQIKGMQPVEFNKVYNKQIKGI